ncbi:MAG: hypothetical protein PVI90_13275 [Desulfobacteraceae bacterium]|jgi:2-keto-4-pentenoate hydratase
MEETLIKPMIEPEVAFVLGKPLRSRNIFVNDVMRATDYVTPTLEIVDSCIKDWNIKWVDTVADNGSSARFVLSDRAFSPSGIDSRTLGMVIEKNRSTFATAAMAEVLGNPARAVC